MLKTIISDILLKTDPPIPVSNRYWGFPKNTEKKPDQIFRVSGFLYKFLYLF